VRKAEAAVLLDSHSDIKLVNPKHVYLQNVPRAQGSHFIGLLGRGKQGNKKQTK
jgi:hypothetical protein